VNSIVGFDVDDGGDARARGRVRMTMAKKEQSLLHVGE
jgi:hypothetical protein